jgi:biopolymer transport protein ExbB/TolQ
MEPLEIITCVGMLVATFLLWFLKSLNKTCIELDARLTKIEKEIKNVEQKSKSKSNSNSNSRNISDKSTKEEQSIPTQKEIMKQ